MKVSLFGYNRKETDDYFSYLNNSNMQLNEELRKQKERIAELEKTVADYKELDDVNKQEIEMLRQQISNYEAAENAYKQQIADLNEQMNEAKSETSENEKLGIIFAVAYRDMENKNKAVSAKIKEYANMMFHRMATYRNEVAGIINSVTEMQNQQKQALQELCDEATRRIDSITEISDQTIKDMEQLECGQGRINAEIDAMISETINTDTAGHLTAPRDAADNETLR